MAHSRTARKRVRQNIEHRARNRWRLRIMRDAIKDLNEKLLHGTVEDTSEQFRKVSQIIDRTAAKGVIHKNTAARRKSRLSARVKAKKLAAAAKPA
ncbi:MAG: 30S ribosomal protein S20 [Planctomycetota bacterium]|nr:30S ribosomal protein S20 [Planctomycetota bacterium]